MVKQYPPFLASRLSPITASSVRPARMPAPFPILCTTSYYAPHPPPPSSYQQGRSDGQCCRSPKGALPPLPSPLSFLLLRRSKRACVPPSRSSDNAHSLLPSSLSVCIPSKATHSRGGLKALEESEEKGFFSQDAKGGKSPDLIFYISTVPRSFLSHIWRTVL